MWVTQKTADSPTELKTSHNSNRAAADGSDVSRSLPGKAVVNLSDHFRVAQSQTLHLRRARNVDSELLLHNSGAKMQKCYEG